MKLGHSNAELDAMYDDLMRKMICRSKKIPENSLSDKTMTRMTIIWKMILKMMITMTMRMMMTMHMTMKRMMKMMNCMMTTTYGR